MHINKIFKGILIPMLLSFSWCNLNSTDHTKKDLKDKFKINSLDNIATNDPLGIPSEKQGNRMPNQTKKSLEDIITTKRLGKIETNDPNGIPSEKQVKEALKSRYPQLNLSEIRIEIYGVINEVVIFAVSNGLYTGHVELSYTALQPGKQTLKDLDLNKIENQTKKKLQDIIKIKSLGNIKTNDPNGIPSQEQVKEVLKKQVPSVKS